MKPYLKTKQQGAPKLKAVKTDYVPGTAKGVSKKDKLVTKNANRSRKKAARQEAKKQINEEL